MPLFTDNPLEPFMREIPAGGPDRLAGAPDDLTSPCAGCGYRGPAGCIICYREFLSGKGE